MKNLLEYMGIDSRRVRMAWISASEGQKFADVVEEMTKDIKELGPIKQFRIGGNL